MNAHILTRYFSLVILSSLLVGCGQGFQTIQPGGDQSSLDAGDAALNSAVYKQSAADVKTNDGRVKWQTSESEESRELSFEYKIPFGRFYKTGASLAKSLIPYSCQLISGINRQEASSYAQGEIPCGIAVDGSWKSMMTLPLDGISGRNDGFDYKISGSNWPIWISRNQKTGTYSEATLDSKSTVQRASSMKFGEDISFRYSPKSNTSRLEVCMNLPGTTIRSSDQTLSAKASKKVLGIKISYSSDFKINAGQATYDYARGCFAVDLGWKGDQLAPTVQLQATQAPYLANASYGGFSIKIKDWFLRLVDSVMGFFKSSLRVQAQNKVVKMANDVLDEDVESGRWFSKIHGEKTLDSIGRKISLELSKSMSRAGTPLSAGDVRVMLKDVCRLKKLSQDKEWTQRMEQLCNDIIDKIEFKIEPFAVDESSKSQGCYNYFGRLNESRGKWWADNCYFAAKFTLKVPNLYKDFAEEIRNLIATKISSKRIPTEWKEAIDKLGVDEGTLALLLENLEKNGYNQVNKSDWQSVLPQILKNINAGRMN